MAGSTTLTIWVYDSAMGAAAGEVRLKDLEQQEALVVHDAVTITWFPGAHEPHIGRVRHRPVATAARGSVLGALVSRVLLAPVTEAEVGVDAGSLLDKAREVGIEPALLEEMKRALGPGRSALVVLSSEADPETVRAVVARGRARGDVMLMYVELAPDAPQAIRNFVAPAGPRDE